MRKQCAHWLRQLARRLDPPPSFTITNARNGTYYCQWPSTGGNVTITNWAAGG